MANKGRQVSVSIAILIALASTSSSCGPDYGPSGYALLIDNDSGVDAYVRVRGDGLLDESGVLRPIGSVFIAPAHRSVRTLFVGSDRPETVDVYTADCVLRAQFVVDTVAYHVTLEADLTARGSPDHDDMRAIVSLSPDASAVPTTSPPAQ